jgi:hypothetical protein
MRITALLLAFCAILCAEKKPPEWKIGKVLDSEKAKNTAIVGSSSQTTGDTNSSSTETKTRTVEVRTTQVLIVGDEYAYVVNDTRNGGGNGGLYSAIGHAVANRKHGCRYIIGDTVRYYQDKGTLHVIDADKKECKTEIMRQERLQQPKQ